MMRANKMLICTCGETAPHEIARSSTADGKHVLLWSDGSLTWVLGFAIKGSPHPRTEKARAEALRAGRLVLGEVCLYDENEVPALIAAAWWTAKRDGLPGTLRDRLHSRRQPKPKPNPYWTVLQTDRNGRPIVRIWRLPRMLFGRGMAVWHERGRYELMREVPGSEGTYKTTGFSSTTLSGLNLELHHIRRADTAKNTAAEAIEAARAALKGE